MKDPSSVSSFRQAVLCYGLFLGTYLLYWILFIVSPDWHGRYIQGEDRTVEWITFSGFAGALLLALSLLQWRSRLGRIGRLYVIGIALFCLMCAGEEISWGQRLIGFQTPDRIATANEQKEFNLHNLELEHIHPKDLVSWSLKVFGVILPLVVLLRGRRTDSGAEYYLPPPFLIPCFLFPELISAIKRSVARAVSSWVDDGAAAYLTTHISALNEELEEMYWGLSMLLALLMIYRAWARRNRTTTAPP